MYEEYDVRTHAAPVMKFHVDHCAKRPFVGTTDDAMLLGRGGYAVRLVPSTPANVKITTPQDLPLAGALLSWEVETDV